MYSSLRSSDTIFALSSGAGKSAVAIIRISGSKITDIIQTVTDSKLKPRRASLIRIKDPQTGELIDRGIVIWFPGPNSFTGEDCLEFQVHGSRAVVSALHRILGQLPGVRAAEAGEFSRRALENDKLDLIGVEALGDLINAETEEQRKLASVMASGALQTLGHALREQLINLMMIVETALDFSDEVDLSDDTLERLNLGLKNIQLQLEGVLASYRCAERVRDGLTVLIAGPPNAGKSSLLNAIARREVAIVSEFAGTTRDLIEIRLDLDGFPVNLVDSAGLREGADPVEREGIQRALAKAQCADLVLWLCSIDTSPQEFPAELSGRPFWQICSKSDLQGDLRLRAGDASSALDVSVKTGENIGLLIDRLKAFAKENMTIGASIAIANERQQLAMSSACDAVAAAQVAHLPLEVVAEELRSACFSLECLMGKVGVEDILDSLFAQFCIGK